MVGGLAPGSNADAIGACRRATPAAHAPQQPPLAPGPALAVSAALRLGQRRGLFGGIALLSCATLVLQIALTRLYSALFGHHLAFLAISLSLFGVGLGGVLLYVAPALARPPRLFARLAYLSGATSLATIAAILLLMQSSPIGDLDAATLGRVALLYVVSASPFTFVGVAVAAGLRHAARDVSRLYLFDLLGAAAGGLGAVAALRAGAPRAVLIAAVLAALGGVVFALGAREQAGPYSEREAPPHAGVIATLALGSAFLLAGDLGSPWLKLPSLKHVPMENVKFSRWNEMALITVDKPVGGMAWMRMDGSAATAILDTKTTPPLHPDEMAYVLHGGTGPVLVIGSGGGRDLRAALKAGQTDIYAAEINPLIVDDVMRGAFKEFSGGLYDRPEIHAEVADGRSFVRRSPLRFKNIVLSLVDTWAAASVGALALTENSLYTVEAFEDFLEHLAPDGTLLVNRWDNEFERLLALGVAGLRAAGAAEPKDHLFACGASRSTSLLVKRTPLTSAEIARLRGHCRKNKFVEAFAPDAPHGELRRRIAAATDVRAVAPDHPTDLTPPTDDRPFFFYTVPTRRLWSTLGSIKALKADQQGLLTLAGLCVVSVGVALVMLLGPLAAKRTRVLRAADRGARVGALGFFLCLGAGFVLVEVALVQHFVMFLGHPIYALSTVLVALLLWTGVGSYLTAKVDARALRVSAARRAQLLVGALALAAIALGPVLRHAVSLPLPGRLAITLALLAPLGILMGSQAPLGIRLVEARAPELIPWCWGLNGVASVVATAVGTLAAMHAGFSALLLAAGAAYLLAAAIVPAPPAAPVSGADQAGEAGEVGGADPPRAQAGT